MMRTLNLPPMILAFLLVAASTSSAQSLAPAICSGPLHPTCTAVTLGDLDGDGDLDAVATANVGSPGQGYCEIMRNDGAGTFVVEAAVPFGAQPNGVAIDDLDGDGNADIVISSGATGSPMIGILQGSGSTAGPWTVISICITTGEPTTVRTADLNGDGKSEILAMTQGTNPGITILVNQTTGPGTLASFTVSPQFVLQDPANPVAARDFVVADFDGQNGPDIAVARGPAGGPNAIIHLSTSSAPGGAPAFTVGATINISSDAGNCLTSSDFNGDGSSDLALTTDTSGTVHVLSNTYASSGGTSLFSVGPAITGIPSSQNVESADLDLDGDADLVIARTNPDDYTISALTVLANDGTGTFGPPTDYTPCANAPLDVDLGDLDGDGLVDVAAACVIEDTPSTMSGRVSFHLNNSPYYPGSGADLELVVTVNGSAPSTAPVIPASPGVGLAFSLLSPLGGFDGEIPVILTTLGPAASPPSPLSGFPEVYVSTATIIAFDGTDALGDPFIVLLPPAPGLTFQTLLSPSITPGTSIYLQGAVLAPNPSNPLFTTTDLREIRL